MTPSGRTGAEGKPLNEFRELSPDAVRLGDVIYGVVTLDWPRIIVIWGKVTGYNEDWGCYFLSNGWNIHKSRAFRNCDEAKAYRTVVETAAVAAYNGGRK